METLVVALWTRREVRLTLPRSLQRFGLLSLSIWIAATVFFAISGFEPLFNRNTPLGVLFGPLAVLTIVFFVSNSWLVAIAVGLEEESIGARDLVEEFQVAGGQLLQRCISGRGPRHVSKLTARALFGSLVIIVPLLVVSYLTFRTAMGRVEDTNQHLRSAESFVSFDNRDPRDGDRCQGPSNSRPYSSRAGHARALRMKSVCGMRVS